jgi:DNA-binding GntR family transcriptional regulator
MIFTCSRIVSGIPSSPVSCRGRTLNGYPRTAGQSAAEQIRGQILSGALAPGATLNQNELAHAMGMSRIPVRDALRTLAAEGLIRMRAHSPATVTALSLDDLRELYDIRLALEPQLCVLALEHLDATDLAVIEDALHALEAATGPEEWLQLNNEYHDLIYRKSGRQRSVEIIRHARRATDRYIRIYRTFDPTSVDVEHRQIFDALKSGHARRLASLVAAHLSGGYETMLRYGTDHHGFPNLEEDSARRADEHEMRGRTR